jgi:hypothetical protein
MALDPVTAGIDLVREVGSSLIKHFFPDPAQQAAAEEKMAELETSGALAAIAGQLAINQEEAKSTNWFIAGWRPAVGWVCVLAFAYSFVVLPFLQFGIYTWGSIDLVKQFAQLPRLDLSAMMPLLLGMLGLGGMRTMEKIKGAEGNR